MCDREMERERQRETDKERDREPQRGNRKNVMSQKRRFILQRGNYGRWLG